MEPNSNYLFRVVGASAGHPLEISLPGHKMTVIASDGNEIDPISNVDSLIVNSGERFDFYIQTKDYIDRKNYIIIVRSLESLDFNFKPLKVRHAGLAILRYKGADSKQFSCGDTNCEPCNYNGCRTVNCPYWPDKADGKYECIPPGSFKSKSNTPNEDRDLMETKYKPGTEFEEYFLNFHFAGSVAQRSSINGRRFMMPSLPLFFKKDTSKVK